MPKAREAPVRPYTTPDALCAIPLRYHRSAMTETTRSPRLEIEYCTQCRWLMRAGWMAQELLTTFVDDLKEVALVPGKGGVFDVRLDGELLWSRATERRFPEAAELKRLVRDRVAPERNMGHNEVKGS